MSPPHMPTSPPPPPLALSPSLPPSLPLGISQSACISLPPSPSRRLSPRHTVALWEPLVPLTGPLLFFWSLSLKPPGGVSTTIWMLE